MAATQYQPSSVPQVNSSLRNTLFHPELFTPPLRGDQDAMEGAPQIMTAAELEMRAARVADPGTGMYITSILFGIQY